MEFIKSKTYENVVNSCKREISGVILYELLSQKAKNDGLESLEKVFATLSNQEKTHSKIFQKFLDVVGTKIELNDEEKSNLEKMVVGNVIDSLKMFAIGEIKAGFEIYPAYSKIAREEGFIDIANMYEKLVNVEVSHGRKLEKEIEKLK